VSTSEQPVFGLMGSGEFLPWAEEVDRWLIDHARTGSDRVLILPAASAPEGDDVFDRWSAMGMEHYTRMDLKPEVVPIKTRDDALREEMAEVFAGAGLIFFSGGNPKHLVETFRDTPAWRGILEAIGAGTAFGGCSAGVAFLGEHAPDSQRPDFGPDRYGGGLAYFTGVEFAPHWDALDVYKPGLQAQVRKAMTPGFLHVLLDEETAMVGDGDLFRVMGRGRITIVAGDEDRLYHAGDTFSLTEAGAPA
jgi:cyanophycinase-like exopeptidase